MLKLQGNGLLLACGMALPDSVCLTLITIKKVMYVGSVDNRCFQWYW
jgi:hypothetical protein